MKNLFELLAIVLVVLNLFSSCAKEEIEESDPIIETPQKEQEVIDSVYSFTYNGTNYQLVKINKTWEEASAYAVDKGGYLIEINDENEQYAVYVEIAMNAEIDMTQTRASSGGSFVWLGGNDFAEEGTWVWDGDNRGATIAFWKGNSNGEPINGQYSNWSNDFATVQNALGMGLVKWSLGNPGKWNDLNQNDKLYFLIEF